MPDVSATGGHCCAYRRCHRLSSVCVCVCHTTPMRQERRMGREEEPGSTGGQIVEADAREAAGAEVASGQLLEHEQPHLRRERPHEVEVRLSTHWAGLGWCVVLLEG